jgi:predicted AAA+ superfamily ATPase
MTHFHRVIQIPDLTTQNAQARAVFLWGPRKVGKSSWIRRHLPQAIYIDLLKSDLLAEYSARPSLLRERYRTQLLNQQAQTGCSEHDVFAPIVIDEIQKCPGLLDEVHWLLENTPRRFLITGSSPRKLRRNHANLLGGRAWRREMRPLTSVEIGLPVAVDGGAYLGMESGDREERFDLERAIIRGLIPSHYLSDEWREELRGYVADYLIEEIVHEGAVRSLPDFSDFLRVAAITNAELINYTNVAREVGVSAKVVRSYFQILEDTLLGFRLAPWSRSKKRRLVETEKFYLFDVGVSNFLARRIPAAGTPEFGKSFEHLILMELLAYRAYRSPELEIRFWRTSNQQEVDFILNDKEVAIEIKSSRRTELTDIKHLTSLTEDGPIRHRIIVSCDREPKTLEDRFGSISVLPWQVFLARLWQGDIVAG